MVRPKSIGIICTGKVLVRGTCRATLSFYLSSLLVGVPPSATMPRYRLVPLDLTLFKTWVGALLQVRPLFQVPPLLEVPRLFYVIALLLCQHHTSFGRAGYFGHGLEVVRGPFYVTSSWRGNHYIKVAHCHVSHCHSVAKKTFLHEARPHLLPC